MILRERMTIFDVGALYEEGWRDFRNMSIQPPVNERRDLDSVVLSGCDFRSTSLQGYALWDCVFVRCNFRGADISGDMFDHCDLRGCDFRNRQRSDAKSDPVLAALVKDQQHRAPAFAEKNVQSLYLTTRLYMKWTSDGRLGERTQFRDCDLRGAKFQERIPMEWAIAWGSDVTGATWA